MKNFDAIVESMWDEDYSIWREVDSKSVLDSDGFYTDYTWYSDGDGNHIFIFGDKDIYEPDPNWADREINGDYSEAEVWFVNYRGFDDDLEESLNGKRINESLSAEDFEIPGVEVTILDEWEDEGHCGYEVAYTKGGEELCTAEIWDEDSPVTIYEQPSHLFNRTYNTFGDFASDMEYKLSSYFGESLNKK